MVNELEHLKELFTKLQSTTLRLEKEQILQDNRNDELFMEVLKFLYNPYIVTGLASSKINKIVGSAWSMSLFDEEDNSTLLEIIDYLKKNNTGRDIDLEKVQKFIESNSEYEDMLKQIFTKELKLGIQSTTINKIMGEGYIPQFDVMLAENYFENEEFVEGKEFDLTTKLDGNRCVANYENGKVVFFTRQGQPYGEMPEIESDVKKLKENYTYDGELIAKTDKEIGSEELFRETTSRVRKDGTKRGVVFHVFDMVPSEEFRNNISTMPSRERKKMLHQTIEEANKTTAEPLEWLREVEVLYSGSDVSKINEWLEKITSQGGEGVMINLVDGLYECKRTKQLLKVKKFKTADVRVTGVFEGTGKNAKRLGGITIEFEHKGRIWNCDVGSGFSDDERDLYWEKPELIVGKIVEIKYFEISQNADCKYSMRFPVWLNRIREEKDEISMY